MLIRRVEAEERWDDAFEALPFESMRHELSHLKGCPAYEAVLREVIELATRPHHFHYRAAALFRDIAPLDMGTSVVGEVDPNQVEAMSRATQIATLLPAGSPERNLFDAVSASIG